MKKIQPPSPPPSSSSIPPFPYLYPPVFLLGVVLSRKVTSCWILTIYSSCPANYTDTATSTLCSSYTGKQNTLLRIKNFFVRFFMKCNVFPLLVLYLNFYKFFLPRICFCQSTYEILICILNFFPTNCL